MSKKTKMMIKRTAQECVMWLVIGASVFGSMLCLGMR